MALPSICDCPVIADALLARSVVVSKITSGVRTWPHALTPWALVNNAHVTYPGATGTGIAGKARAHPEPATSSVSRHFSKTRLSRTAVQKETAERRGTTDD